MKRFLRELYLYTGLPHLPEEFESDFSELIEAQFEPQLDGSLQITVHTKCSDQHDPRKISEWQLTLDTSDLTFPTVYVSSTFSTSVVGQLERKYTMLYSNRQFGPYFSIPKVHISYIQGNKIY